MYRLLVTIVWLAVYSATIIGVGCLVIAIQAFVYPKVVDTSDPWYFMALLATGFLGLATAFRAAWSKLVFTESDFIRAVKRVKGVVVSKGRVCRASFGAVEVGYRFPRGFVGFDISWVGPKHSPQRKLIQRWIDKGGGWIAAKHLWNLVINRAPLVIRIPARSPLRSKWSDIYSRLEAVSDGRVLEAWLQRADRGDGVVHLLEQGSTPFQGEDEVLILAYVAPWDSLTILRIVEATGEFGEALPNGQEPGGAGWPPAFC